MSEDMTDVYQNIGKKLEVIDPETTGLFGPWYEVVGMWGSRSETIYDLRDEGGMEGSLALTRWVKEGKLRWIEDTVSGEGTP